MFYTLKNIPVLFLLSGFILSLFSCDKHGNDNHPLIPADTNSTNPPVLHGKIVYHSYSCYSCNDSRLYMYDFETGKLTFLSRSWEITNPMNAHFSPDGKKIVFMGMPTGSSNWDVFIYNPETALPPVNLTPGSPGRDEDPKFSPDGTKIIFKKDGILTETDTTGLILRTFTVPQNEASMPYYTSNADGLLYAANEPEGATLDIFLISTIDGTTRALSSLKEVEEYYPVNRDDTSFLFTRWANKYNQNDQLYLGFFNNRPSVRLPFNQIDNNFSDAFPVDENTIILSSTKGGGQGEYDLYLADIYSGKIWSLNLYNPYINTSVNELGACFSDK